MFIYIYVFSHSRMQKLRRFERWVDSTLNASGWPLRSRKSTHVIGYIAQCCKNMLWIETLPMLVPVSRFFFFILVAFRWITISNRWITIYLFLDVLFSDISILYRKSFYSPVTRTHTSTLLPAPAIGHQILSRTALLRRYPQESRFLPQTIKVQSCVCAKQSRKRVWVIWDKWIFFFSQEKHLRRL